jgi:hypothetical protein
MRLNWHPAPVTVRKLNKEAFCKAHASIYSGQIMLFIIMWKMKGIPRDSLIK